MRTLFSPIVFLTIILFVATACSHPEDPFIGKWEFKSYEVENSGLGSWSDYVPESWVSKLDEWIENGKAISNSTIEFKPDGTYEEMFGGVPNEITTIRGKYIVSKDGKELALISSAEENILIIQELSDSTFVFQKKIEQLQVALTLNMHYSRVND